MSCNGCRILRKGCSQDCILRPCLQWIQSSEAQAHATLFVAKFFGRADLMSFISSVPNHQRPALFQSLLFEACGRTVNPVNGAVGLLTSGNWNICQAAVNTVLHGGVPHPLAPEFLSSPLAIPPPPTTTANTLLAFSNVFDLQDDTLMYSDQHMELVRQVATVSYDGSEMSGTTTNCDNGEDNRISIDGQTKKILNLFV